MRILWLLALLALPMPPAGAEEQAVPAASPDLYQFDLILFVNHRAGAGGTELWPRDPGSPDLEGAVPLVPIRGEAAAFPLVAPRQRQLNQARHYLNASHGHYAPLLQLAWRQPMREGQKAVKLHLRAPLGHAFSVDSTPPALEGTLTLSRRRYLHADFDLLLRTATQASSLTFFDNQEGEDALSTPGDQGFRLQARRRMRSGELHYIDHPLFGALLLATRVKHLHRTAPGDQPTRSGAEKR